MMQTLLICSLALPLMVQAFAFAPSLNTFTGERTVTRTVGGRRVGPLFLADRVKVEEAPSSATISSPTEDDIDENVRIVDGYMKQSMVELEGGGGASSATSFSYVDFAQKFPFANNVIIATCKTAAADLLAQTAIAQTPLDALDWERSLLFCLFGAVYLGGFQYFYQVGVFKKLFDVDSFTSQSLEEKLKDGPGLKALAAQTILDLGVLTAIYLPTFYIFKASVFSGSPDPSVWFDSGLTSYQTNFAKDEFDLIRVWLPADLVCFSVPLYLRLPVRHVVSFVWTAYLSFARGGH